MMADPRRQAVALVLVMGVVALVAQLAGVGASRPAPNQPKRPGSITLAVVAGGAVPDVGSTRLHGRRVVAQAGEVLQMRGEAHVQARAVGRDGAAQVVCGLRYSRDGDRSWTLGTPYETIALGRRGARERVVIERSFVAPADDTYRVAIACHVAAPARGAAVRASGVTRFERGLPAGAATPVA